MQFFITLFILLTFSSCSSKSLEDFQADGQAISLSLIHEFQQVNTREELIASSGKIKKLFNSLVDTIIAAREYQQKYPIACESESFELLQSSRLISDQLREEMNRVYQIEGARQIVEKCQMPALEKLDAYKEKQISWKKKAMQIKALEEK